MNKKHLNNVHKIFKKLHLPKINSTINSAEQANQFFQDPQNVSLQQQPQLSLKNYKTPNKNKNFINFKAKSKTQDKLNKHHDIQLSSQQLMEQERTIIKNKMKKFLPTNSSFSLFYGQKISMINRIRDLSSHCNEKVDISQYDAFIKNSHKKLPQLSRISNSKYQQVKSKSVRNIIPITNQLESDKIHSLQYFKRLNKIRQQSKLLRDQSQNLLQKANNTEKFVQRKFQKLKQHSFQILSESKKYKLQQQVNKSYKKIF